MEREATQSGDEAGLEALEEGGGQPGKIDGRRTKSLSFVKMHLYLPLKDAVALKKIELKFLKQGQDITRSRLAGEAIRMLAQAVSEGKFEVKE